MSRRDSIADSDAIDRLATLVSRATIGAYVDLFPHGGAGPMLYANPELRAQGESYYRVIARRLIANGVMVVVKSEPNPEPEPTTEPEPAAPIGPVATLDPAPNPAPERTVKVGSVTFTPQPPRKSKTRTAKPTVKSPAKPDSTPTPGGMFS